MRQAVRSRYVSRVYQSPKLTRAQEFELALRWREQGDFVARDLLAFAQLRHVIAIARGYRRSESVTLDELIAEGNYGLVHALSKFDPARDIRLVTYAAHWIRAYILQYLTRSRSLVTAGVHSKTFREIKRLRRECLQPDGQSVLVNQRIALRLGVSEEKLGSLLERIDCHDVSWDAAADEPGRPELPPHHSPTAEEEVLADEAGEQLSVAVSSAVAQLDERERYIVERRLMADPEDSLTLAELGRRWGISRERVRQLEVRAVRKIKAVLARASVESASRVGSRAA